MITIKELQHELASPFDMEIKDPKATIYIVSGEPYPKFLTQPLWARAVIAEADGFEKGYSIAMRIVIARMKELAASTTDYVTPICFHNLAEEFRKMK